MTGKSIGWAGVVGLGIMLGSLPWVRLNISASVSRGFHRLHRVPAPLTYGQLMLVDVPGALRPWWPRRTPLLKPVAGPPGDVLTIRDNHFYVNERDYGPVIQTAAGMPLPQVSSPTVISTGEVCRRPSRQASLGEEEARQRVKPLNGTQWVPNPTR